MAFIKKVKTQADYKQDHDKMYKENHWYKVWYDTMVEGQKLKKKLSSLAGSLQIYLDDPMPLPEGCDKREWAGYVLVTEGSIKHLLKEGEEAEKLLNSLKK